MMKHPLMQWNMQQMKKLTIPILYIMIIYSVIILFNPTTTFIFVFIISLYLLTTIGTALWKKKPISIKKLFFGLIRMLIVLTIIILLARYLVIWWGFLGYLVFLGLFTTYILIKRRKQYVDGMRIVEKQIWGKPLDRKNWEDEADGLDEEGKRVSGLDVANERHVSSMSSNGNSESPQRSKERQDNRRNCRENN